MTFGNRLRLLRNEKGLTLLDMAKLFNSSKTTFSNYERAYRKPDMNLITEIADYFNVSVDWLLCRVDKRKNAVMEEKEIPKELKELGVNWLEVTKEFKDKGFTPEEVRKVIDAIEILNKK